MKIPRKICIVTGSRAEYGLLSLLIKRIHLDSDLKLQLIATGMHLSPEFGLTFREIETDGIVIDEKIEMLLSSDSAVGVTQSLGLGVIGFANAYKRLVPDIVVVLGDRFEILAAAQAAMIACIPIAHIHGGETTEGAYDEGIRHSITKMAHWHFVATEVYRKRVVQMGESPNQVFNVGALSLDGLSELPRLTRQNLENLLSIKLKSPIFLVTYHPVTLSDKTSERLITEFLDALETFDIGTFIFTYPNADTDGRVIIEQIDKFVQKFPDRCKAFISLGRTRYLNLMRYSDIVIGNSSSGIIEAPFFKKATVNIGDRQKGRLKALSVIDTKESKDDIIEAIEHALSDTHTQSLSNIESLYGCGQTVQMIIDKLKCDLPSIGKKFFDIEHRY